MRIVKFHHQPPTKGINNISYRKFKHFDAQSFRAGIAVQPWDELMPGTENTNRMWLKWKSLFLEVCDKHAPIRIKRVRASRSPWINNDLKKTMSYENSFNNQKPRGLEQLQKDT